MSTLAARKCSNCGCVVPVTETDPPSGFVDWASEDVASLLAERDALRNQRDQLQARLDRGDLTRLHRALRAEARVETLNDDRKQLRERAISAEQALALYGPAASFREMFEAEKELTAAAEARVEALQPYLRHRFRCAASATAGGLHSPGPCSCGLAALAPGNPEHAVQR